MKQILVLSLPRFFPIDFVSKVAITTEMSKQLYSDQEINTSMQKN